MEVPEGAEKGGDGNKQAESEGKPKTKIRPYIEVNTKWRTHTLVTLLARKSSVLV